MVEAFGLLVQLDLDSQVFEHSSKDLERPANFAQQCILPTDDHFFEWGADAHDSFRFVWLFDIAFLVATSLWFFAFDLTKELDLLNYGSIKVAFSVEGALGRRGAYNDWLGQLEPGVLHLCELDVPAKSDQFHQAWLLDLRLVFGDRHDIDLSNP